MRHITTFRCHPHKHPFMKYTVKLAHVCYFISLETCYKISQDVDMLDIIRLFYVLV
jgi:hypothetical protein